MCKHLTTISLRSRQQSHKKEKSFYTHNTQIWVEWKQATKEVTVFYFGGETHLKNVTVTNRHLLTFFTFLFET